jgi:WD40 repeat protein
VTALCFLPDSKSLVAADGSPGGPGRIQLYQLPDPQPRLSVNAHNDAIFSLQRSPGGEFLASASADKLVKLWELPSLKELAKLEGHTNHVLALAFNRDGTLLASASADREVKVWDVKTHEQKISIGPHAARVNALAWPAANTLAAIGDDGSIHIDSDSSKSPGRAMTPAEDTLYCVAATADGKTFFAGCHDGKVYVWSGGKPGPALDEADETDSRR